MSWRDRMRPIIAETLAMCEQLGVGEAHLQLELRAAWDVAGFGPRRHWPYKVWRDEIARQRGRVRGRLTPRGRSLPEWHRQRSAERAGQLALFEPIEAPD